MVAGILLLPDAKGAFEQTVEKSEQDQGMFENTSWRCRKFLRREWRGVLKGVWGFLEGGT